MSEKIGFIGLGIMGSPMAKNLINSGFEVYAFDIIEKNLDNIVNYGAKKALSPKEVSENSDIVIVMVQNSPQSEKVVLGEEAHLKCQQRKLNY